EQHGRGDPEQGQRDQAPGAQPVDPVEERADRLLDRQQERQHGEGNDHRPEGGEAKQRGSAHGPSARPAAPATLYDLPAACGGYSEAARTAAEGSWSDGGMAARRSGLTGNRRGGSGGSAVVGGLADGPRGGSMWKAIRSPRAGGTASAEATRLGGALWGLTSTGRLLTSSGS